MKYLCAIEADDFDAQPHASFTKGFIKSYCKHLGLDENYAVLRYEMFLREKSERVDDFRSYDEKEGKKRPYLPDRPGFDKKYLYAAAVIIAVFYFVFIRKGPKTAPQTANVAAQAKDMAVQPKLQPQTQPQVKAVVQPGAQEKAAIAGKAVAAKTEKPLSNDEVKDTARPAANGAAKDAAKAVDDADNNGKKHSVSISASELVWIKMGIDDKPAFNVILKDGESASWMAGKGFHLVVGNAGGVSITFDGKKLAPLGPSGKVVNINLPQGFVDAKPTAPPAR